MVLTISNGGYAGNGVYAFVSRPVITSSVGLSLAEGVPSAINANASLSVPLYLYYGNGTRMNATDTLLAFPLTTLYVMQGNIIVHTYAAVSYSPGEMDFSVAALPAGYYTFFAVVLPFNISGVPVHASVTKAVSASFPVLSPIQSFVVGFEEFFAAMGQNLLVTAVVSVLFIVGAYAGKKLIDYISRKLKRDKKDTQSVDMVLTADIVNTMTASPIPSQLDLATRFAGLSDASQEVFLHRAADGMLKNYPVIYMNRTSNLMELRIMLEKLSKQKGKPKIFEWLRKRAKEVN
jgi:hypothetical protein